MPKSKVVTIHDQIDGRKELVVVDLVNRVKREAHKNIRSANPDDVREWEEVYDELQVTSRFERKNDKSYFKLTASDKNSKVWARYELEIIDAR